MVGFAFLWNSPQIIYVEVCLEFLFFLTSVVSLCHVLCSLTLGLVLLCFCCAAECVCVNISPRYCSPSVLLNYKATNKFFLRNLHTLSIAVSTFVIIFLPVVHRNYFSVASLALCRVFWGQNICSLW